MIPNKPRLFFACLLLTLAGQVVWALPEDRTARIELESDQYIYDHKNGLIIYTGSAELRQGSLQINADKITVYYRGDANVVEKIEAHGSPAHLQQLPSADAELVKARAEEIIYHRLENTIEMRVSAQLEQDGTMMQGHHIHYDLSRELVQAASDEAGEERIFMTIPAGSLPE